MTVRIAFACVFLMVAAGVACTPEEEPQPFSCTGAFCGNNTPGDTGNNDDDPDAANNGGDDARDGGGDAGDTPDPDDAGDTGDTGDAGDTPNPDDAGDTPDSDDAGDADGGDDASDGNDAEDARDADGGEDGGGDGGDDTGDVGDDTPPDVPDDPRCTRDADCTGIRTCDVNSGECIEAPVCSNADDCGPGRYCDNGDCADEPPECVDNGPQCDQREVCVNGTCEAVNCITDVDCADGRRCDQDSFLCVECFGNDDCSGNQICEFGFCFENFEEGCVEELDCEGRRLCDPEEQLCINPECADDQFEPNESFEEAQSLTPGAYNLTACDQDVDYLKFNVQQGDGFLVLVEFDPREFTLQGAIHRPNGDIVVDVFDQNITGQLIYPVENADESGQWGISVFFSDGTTGPYELTYVAVDGGFCRNDNFEPNDTRAQAGRAQVGQFATLRLCADDEDWYRIPLEAGTEYEWLVLALSGDAVGIEIFEPNAETRVLRDTSPREEKTLAFEAAQTGEYLVHVFHTGDAEPSEYFIGFSERPDF